MVGAGCVDGWDVLLRRFGSKPLAELLAPSITAAEQGFPVSEIIGRGWKGSEKGLAPWADSVRCYLPDGKAPAIGSIFRNPEYAATLRVLADKGRDAFYTGDIARRIVEFSEKNGGYFSLADFAEHTSEWVDRSGPLIEVTKFGSCLPTGRGWPFCRCST